MEIQLGIETKKIWEARADGMVWRNLQGEIRACNLRPTVQEMKKRLCSSVQLLQQEEDRMILIYRSEGREAAGS